MTTHGDDSPVQGGLEHQALALTGQSAHFSNVGLREMVVVDVVFADQPNNRGGAYPEYVVRDIQTGEFLYGVRRLNLLSDPSNGDDNIIHPARNLLPDAKPQRFTKATPVKSTDGSRVLVGFIEGSHNRAVIVGVFAHPSATYGAKASDGERRFTVHKGTSVEIKQDGTYTIIHKSGSTVVLNSDGDIITTPASGRSLFHGSSSASENHVLGQRLKTFLGTMIDALTAATYPTGVGPTGPMLPPSQLVLQQLKAQLNDLLSDMSFTQKDS